MTDSAKPTPKRKVGRPTRAGRKNKVTIGLDPDVLAAWRATGTGWQTRMNICLAEAVGISTAKKKRT